MDKEAKKRTVDYFVKKGILIAPSLLEDVSLLEKAKELILTNCHFLDENVINDLLKSQQHKESKKEDPFHIQHLPTIEIVKNYSEFSSKKEVSDFSMYYNSRLDSLQKILYARDELQGTTSISRLRLKELREKVSLIGLVKDKQITKNKNFIITLEDSTGEMKVLINHTKEDLYKLAKEIILDEVIGISGVLGQNIVFANSLHFPEIPTSSTLKKSPEDIYAIFLSDIHIGSNNFLKEDFIRFIDWLKGDVGNDTQKEIASKIKYLFIIGDLVDGVGIYPNQEADLAIPDIYEQYKEGASLLSKIPKSISIVICAGNHDALRIAEPQPALPKHICPELYMLDNATIVSNPSVVNIAKTHDFPGFDVLMYHGYSFDHYVANVDSIRNQGGYDRADLIMKFLLRKRHLAPTHTSTLYVPYRQEDPLVIEQPPDFFVTGHIHKCAVSNYRNITLISGSCWQSKTAFQEKVGHHPEPGRVPIVNLRTREIKVMRFSQ